MATFYARERLDRPKKDRYAASDFPRERVSTLSQKNHTFAIFNVPPCTFRSDPPAVLLTENYVNYHCYFLSFSFSISFQPSIRPFSRAKRNHTIYNVLCTLLVPAGHIVYVEKGVENARGR